MHYKSDKHVKVEFVDTLSKQNAREHNTHKFDRVYSGELVIRRGQPFDVVLRFNKKFDPHENTIRFVFTTSMCLYTLYNIYVASNYMVRKDNEMMNNNMLLYIFT